MLCAHLISFYCASLLRHLIQGMLASLQFEQNWMMDNFANNGAFTMGDK